MLLNAFQVVWNTITLSSLCTYIVLKCKIKVFEMYLEKEIS